MQTLLFCYTVVFGSLGLVHVFVLKKSIYENIKCQYYGITKLYICLHCNEKHKVLVCFYITHSIIHSSLMGLEISRVTCMNNSFEQHNCLFAIPMYVFVIFVMRWLQKLKLSLLLLFPVFFLFNLLHRFVFVIHCYQKDSICDIGWQANNTQVLQNKK